MDEATTAVAVAVVMLETVAVGSFPSARELSTYFSEQLQNKNKKGQDEMTTGKHRSR